MSDAGVTRAAGSVAAPLRSRGVDGEVLVTSAVGDWVFLSPADFERFASGQLQPGDALYGPLAERHLLTEAPDHVAASVRRARRRWAFLGHGPSLHAVSLDGGGAGEVMSRATADRVVDTAFMTTSTQVTLELTATDVPAQLPLARRLVSYAQGKNALARKDLRVALAAAPEALGDADLDWLVADGVRLRALIDPLTFGAPGDPARARLEALAARRGPDAAAREDLEAVVTPSPAGLSADLGWIDALAALGCRVVTLAPVEAFPWQELSAPPYPMDAWLAFYERALEHLLALSRGDAPIRESLAAAFLARILRGDDPGHRDVRNPGTDGLGQLAYAWDGTVYTSQDGLRLGALGDPMFAIGRIETSGYHDLIAHPTVRALLLATALDGQPDCAGCAYNPYCGQRPVRNYAEQGSVHGRMRDSATCRKHKRIQDLLFTRLRRGADREILEAWADAAL
jgi:hypothetical protein